MDVLLLLMATEDKIGEKAPKEIVQKIGGFAMQLASEGKLKGGNQLSGINKGLLISQDGQVGRAIDGPYAELKELVGGYFELDVESMEEAQNIAKNCPHLGIGRIIVQPILPRGPS